MICGETNVMFTGMDGQGQPLPWAWELVGGIQQKSAVQAVTPDAVFYHYSGVNYFLKLSPDEGSCRQLTSGVIRLTPNDSGKLEFILDGF